MSRFLVNESDRLVLAHLKREVERASRHEEAMAAILEACAGEVSGADAAVLQQRLDDARAVLSAADAELRQFLETCLTATQPSLGQSVGTTVEPSKTD